MLHVTNGESAVQGLRDAGLEGDILAWRDVLHEGPVPAGLDEAALREVRARFIAACGWDRYDSAHAALARRDTRLLRARDEDEVVLWFEHDLYDQLQLVEVLGRLADRARRPQRVSHVPSSQYLATAPAEWFRTEFVCRDPVSPRAWEEAERTWQAFRQPDPQALDALRREVHELPFLAGALTRHLQEFPSVRTGLSRFEGQLLAALADGPQDLLAAYHASHHDVEDAVFLGDVVFAWHASRLSRSDPPLVVRLDGLRVAMPDTLTPAYWEQRLMLAPLGERILAGEIDRVPAAGIDRWLGGVHLLGKKVRWRWDEQRSALVGTP
jgi:hypothetical protein